MKTKISALIGVSTGILLLLIGGGGPPTWLANLLAAFFCTLALLYGFTAFTPSAPAWLSSRPVLGVASVYMGVAVILVPANIVTSAFFLGLGIRLLMAEWPPLTVKAARVDATLARNDRDIILRGNSPVAVREAHDV